MYDVMTNGIGGVNAGGVPYDVVPGRGQEMALNDSKAYQYLIRTPDHAVVYMKMGYLIPKKMAGGRHGGYVLTPEGRKKFAGSELVNTWIKEETIRKAVEKEERHQAKLIKNLKKSA